MVALVNFAGADRINVVEGIFSDLMHGSIPNIPAEMGIRAELKFNKAGFARHLIIAALVLGAIISLAVWML